MKSGDNWVTYWFINSWNEMKAFFPLVGLFIMSYLARAKGWRGFGSWAIEIAGTNFLCSSSFKTQNSANVETHPVVGLTGYFSAHHPTGVNGVWDPDPITVGWWQRRDEAIVSGHCSVEFFLWPVPQWKWTTLEISYEKLWCSMLICRIVASLQYNIFPSMNMVRLSVHFISSLYLSA